MPRQRRLRTLERLEARQLLAADISLVADLNATLLGAASDPRDFVQLNGAIYFSAASPASGRELWRTDGTPEGTSIVRDIAAGVDSSSPGSLRNIDGTLYFTATDSAHGRELWRSDGTAAGTKIVRDIGPGRSSGVEYSEAIVKAGWNIYFAANDGVHGEELWKTNGTWNSTALVADINATAGSKPHDLTQFHGALAFVAEDGVNGNRLWRTNGSAVATKLIDSSLKASGPAQLVDVSGQLFFSAFDAGFGNELWRSDGTAAGTQRVKEIVSGPTSSSPASLVNLNGKLAFTAVEYQKDGGMFLSPERELWASDGTAAGTQRVLQINPSTAGSDPSELTNIRGTLYFSAYEPVDGREVWKSDLTAAGTVRVADIAPGPANSDPSGFKAGSGSTVFFFASTAAAGRELWQTTGGTTSLVADIAPGAASSFVRDDMASVNGTVFFAANDGVHGSKLWRSDGTQTAPVGDVYNTTGDSNPQELTDVDGVLYFTAKGGHVWRTDGTAAGTQLLFSGAARSLVSFNGKLFFQGNGVLYQSDGTPGGTVPVQTSGDIAQQPYWLTNVNGTLFFATTDNKLWKSDGTSAGTVEVTEFDFGSGRVFPGLLPSSLFNAQGTLFFSADRGDGAELWKSDGTDAGTVQVADLAPGRFEGFYGQTYPNSSAPNSFTESGGTLYFLASNGLNKTDGTASGTVAIDTPAANDGAFREPFDFEGRLYFFTTDAATHSDLLWATLGTSATTSLIHEFSRVDSDPHAANLANVDGTLFFTDAHSGLWKSDGTAAGTRLVRDLSTSNFNAAPHLLTPVGNSLYFIASDSTHGDELWMSDGTSGGTHIVADTIAAGGLGATNPEKNPQIRFVDQGLREIITPATPAPPGRMEVIGNDLFFSTVSNEAGRELWSAQVFNAPPVLTITGTPTYVEKNPVVAIAPTATLTDVDSAALQNGLLTATIVDNLSPGDRLRVKNVGTGSGQIGVSGDVISYGGKQIGTLSGQDGTLLSVRLNGSATLAAVQALIRSIGFATSGDAPVTSPRSITISVSDGDGGIGEATVAVAIQAVNDAPLLGGISGSIGYVHDDPAIVLAAIATVTDFDSPDLAGGRLQVRIGSGASSSNRLWLGNGCYADADNNVHFGSIVIGQRLSDGIGLHDLVIAFNANATPSVVQEVLRGIRFKTYVGAAGQRTMAFTVSDGDGGVSGEAFKTVNVS